MKKTAALFAIALFLLFSNTVKSNILATSSFTAYKKYDIKSGIITYESTMQMGGMDIKSKKILYFDDFGIKECEEEYTVDATGTETLKKRDFVKDGFRYTCSLDYGNGAKTKARGYGVAAPFNQKEASTMKDNQYKVLPDETICAKKCGTFSMVTPSGNIKMSGWNRVTLKTVVDNESMGLKSEIIATKIQENAAIPADKFEVPKGVVMKDM